MIRPKTPAITTNAGTISLVTGGLSYRDCVPPSSLNLFEASEGGVISRCGCIPLLGGCPVAGDDVDLRPVAVERVTGVGVQAAIPVVDEDIARRIVVSFLDAGPALAGV